LFALALLGASPMREASADGLIQIRLSSPDTMIDVEGAATLRGQSLSGHLTADNIDVVVTGVVKNQTVSVDLVGRFVPGCRTPRQSMDGIGSNQGEGTSIDMTFHCDGKASGSGEEYQFRLNLILPRHPLYSPLPSSSGESASLQ
jgi:hypothetical protein